jgi:hypothetical protein
MGLENAIKNAQTGIFLSLHALRRSWLAVNMTLCSLIL